MSALHFVERLGNYRQVDGDTNEWESGYWAIKPEAAAQFIGGSLYLHKGQKEPSYIGGIITGFRIDPARESERLIFRFIKKDDHEGVTTAAEGWGNEQKRILD